MLLQAGVTDPALVGNVTGEADIDVSTVVESTKIKSISSIIGVKWSMVSVTK